MISGRLRSALSVNEEDASGRMYAYQRYDVC